MSTVLVVEDDESLRELLADVLAFSGYRVLTAMDGQQALDVAATESPDLVVSDLMMPVLNGCDLARALRSDPRYRHLPCVAISGAAELAAQAGQLFTRVLAKPFGMVDLVSAIAECLAA